MMTLISYLYLNKQAHDLEKFLGTPFSSREQVIIPGVDLEGLSRHAGRSTSPGRIIVMQCRQPTWSSVNAKALLELQDPVFLEVWGTIGAEELPT